MFKSYLKTAWRSLMRHKSASLVKLSGLAIGMACCMLILIYINDELSYNTFCPHYSDIYRVNFVKHGDGETRVMAGSANSVGPAIAKDVSQVAAVGRLYNRSGILEVKEGGEVKRFQEPRVYFADEGVFNVFSIQGGDLKAPNSIVLTKELARKYFGRQDVIGRSMTYENGTLLRVTGVVDALPANSDIHFDALISFETLYTVEPKGIADFLRSNWLYNPCETYVLLKPSASLAAAEATVEQLTQRYGDERLKKSYFFSLQPLAAMHLHASGVEGNPSTNSITYIYIFSAIAFLILLMANINFINLSNAQSLTRIAEIGVRKVSGADSRQLLLQFLGEGLLLSGIAFVVALLLTLPGLSLLNTVTGKSLQPDVLLRVSVLLVFAGLLLGSGLLAGIYPAVFITRMRLTALLKGQPGDNRISGNRIRQSLIVTQFVIAIALVTGAIVIQRQLSYLRNKPLGFDKEQLVVLPLFGKNPSLINSGVDGPLRARMKAFENDLRANTAIRAVTLSSVLPGDFFVSGLVIPEGHTEKDNIFIPWASVDYDFIPTLGAPLVAGRDFSKATGTDHLQAFVINESAVRTFGWKSAGDAIGKTMIRGSMEDGKKGHVIGVIKDFNFGRLDRPQQPLILDVNVPRFTTFAVRVRPDHLPETIGEIHRLWDRYFPERMFEYSFLDENINALYNVQENLSRLVRYFALIAIFISCTGLFALAAFMATQRTREIGIRKVLGASVASVVVLLFSDFLRLAVLALLISIPFAWWTMNRWLHDFAYRITLSWWFFAAAGLLAVGIAFLTVGMQGLRAARVSPVRSLRNE
ncbi:ABC transporter permease [Puia dinghuensis]|uniref:ABC transporter permease n=1 Tax=Puia dinghuensis TaxID=1792502 RepID=A0A8J2UH46_9BACT|nr:ABC transporter permease [Puia dinghuensis]GGB17192.1 ABC transporter permease [Puia dinghuensis]